jgi:hypothetical protein
MGRGKSGIMNTNYRGCTRKEACEAVRDARYTQESTSSEYVRTNDQLQRDKIRNASLGEGVAFVEKI